MFLTVVKALMAVKRVLLLHVKLLTDVKIKYYLDFDWLQACVNN